MSRDDRRDSYLRSEHCHMCGHMLGPGMSFIRKPGGKKEVCFCKLRYRIIVAYNSTGTMKSKM